MAKHIDDIALVQTIVLITFSIVFIFFSMFYKFIHEKEYNMHKYYKNNYNNEYEYDYDYTENCYQKNKIV
jgi:hypothetical protein